MNLVNRTINRALISVYDKTGLVSFAQGLQAFGIELLSTGGTARALQEAGLPVTLVEDVTGFGEMLDGRVKTLHPHVHAGILADRDNDDHMRQLAEAGIKPIDMVVVSLYPFERTIAEPDCTFEQAIEMIDIGGVALLRAAAKNHKHVWVFERVPDAGDVARFFGGEVDEAGRSAARRELAQRALEQTCAYDGAISRWLSLGSSQTEALLHLHLTTRRELRYGENPHQSARLMTEPVSRDAPLIEVDHSVEVPATSYNNYVDADAALALCADLHREIESNAVAVFIKHTNACGAAVGGDAEDVYRRAYLGDPNAAMGGVLAVNFGIDRAFAVTLMETFQRYGKPLQASSHPHPPGAFFVEVIVAPGFDDDAVAVIRGADANGPQKEWGKRVRLLATRDLSTPPSPEALQLKRIAGTILTQTPDDLGLDEDNWQVVTAARPTEQQRADLRLAWLVCKHTKSNAITICRDGMLLGAGAGQMSRVTSCRLATWLSQENGHSALLDGAVAASDAFFPFSDGPQLLIDAGVRAIIQPGGSKRDDETVALCNRRDVAMVFTGVRHFRH